MKNTILSKSHPRARGLIGCCVLLFLCIFLASPAWGTNWYVSKAGAGVKNGTSVENAWAQGSIGWASMAAGDTLYVVGVLHGLNGLTISKSGSVNNYFTISGYDENSGIVFGPEYESASWNGPDAYGAYSIDYTNDNCKGLIEWPTASGPFGYTILTNAGKDPDNTWAAGNYYANTTSNKIYWKPVGGTIANKTVTVGAAFTLAFDGLSWVKFTNMKLLLTPIRIGVWGSSSYIWIDHITTRYAYYYAIRIRAHQDTTGYPNDHIRISYSTISNAPEGIYSLGQVEGYDNNYVTIDHNTITDISGSGDAHCIGFQGGDNHLIEYNDLSYCNTGITMYSSIWQSMNNSIIRYNHVHHMEKNRVLPYDVNSYGRGYGIGWEGTNPVADQMTGNQIYGNIVHDNNGFGMNIKFVSSSNYLSNNTARANDVNYRVTGVNATYPVGGVVKNNISLNPVSYHWYVAGGHNGDLTGLTFDNNNYYPDGSLFRFGGVSYSFADWKTQVKAAGIVGYDNNSISSNPLLSNGSGTYSLISDFKPASGSPTVDRGDNTVWSGKPDIFDITGSVGITSSSGTIIAPGGVVDIGAYEVAGPEYPTK